MKYFLIIITLCFGACVKTKNKACITYAEATQEDCVPTYSRLQEKDWVLDSVVMNSKNITYNILKPLGGGIKINFPKLETTCYKYITNLFVLAIDRNNKKYNWGMWHDAKNDQSYTGLNFIANSYSDTMNNNLVLGFYEPAYSHNEIVILSENNLKIKFISANPDSIFYNYFSIH
jgi:hypothetical protein